MDGRRLPADDGPRTLLIPLESARGFAADGVTTGASFALEEAIAARSAFSTVLPAFEEIASHLPHTWPFHAPRMLGDASFDQAWVWLGRTPFDEVFLEWLASVAPIRIGVLAHPLTYPAETYRRSPHLLAHGAGIEEQLRYMTHVIACDEVDADAIADRAGLPALWLPPVVGASMSPAAAATARVTAATTTAPEAATATLGTATAAATSAPRTPVFVDEVASDAGSLGPLGEDFAALQRELITSLATGGAGAATAESLWRYVASRRTMRLALAERRARALGQAGIAVTRAHDASSYPAVVMECMAAGVPVVCHDIPYRPRNRALFVPGRHIRLFGSADQATLAGHVRDLQHDPSAAQAQVDAALAVIQRTHTAERRVDQVFEWLSTGRAPDVASDEDRSHSRSQDARYALDTMDVSRLSTGRVADRACDEAHLHSRSEALDATAATRAPNAAAATGATHAPDGTDARRWFLPASYRRRTVRTVSRPGEEGDERLDIHRLAVALAHACACTRLVDIGCPEPSGLVRVARDISAVGICATDILQSYQRRCADVAWHDIGADPSSLLADAGVGLNERTLVLSAMQFERSDAPDALAATLSRFVARGRCGLVVSVDRDRTWGPDDAGPPPTPAHLQEWAPDELVELLRDAGLRVLYQVAFPAVLGRRESAHRALVVVHESETPTEVREQVRLAAESACEAYMRQRVRLSENEYELVEAIANRPPAFVMTAVPNAPETPALQALLGDDRWVAVHSGRAPIDEARRWAESVRCEGDGPIVLYGLGLGYHALALAHARPAGAASRRLIVVEPFADVVARARELPATREALDDGRIELVDGWRAFRALMQARPPAPTAALPLASICLASIPVYERIADREFPWFSTFLHGAIAWARAGLERDCKPYLHAEGMSVVITTYNRVEQAAALVDGIATQQPCGVPVEILLVNDHGTTEVFEAARAVARRTGCVLRLFDTYYTGYGPALARNVGLRFARYDTTVFLDDDVEVGPDLLRCYRDAPDGIRMGRIDFLHGGGDSSGVRPRRVPDRRVALRGPSRLLRPAADYEGFMWSANCAVPTEVALTLGGFDEAFLDEGEEDLDFSARTVRATHRPVAVPSAVALHQELDLSAGAALTGERKARISRANERLADPARGLVVNGGMTYWAGDRWQRYVVTRS